MNTSANSPLILPVTAVLLCAWLLLAAPASGEPVLPAYSIGYSAQRDPFADGRDALALARSSGRRVLIEVGGDWCAWCHQLERLISQHPELDAGLQQGFVLLKVNVSGDNPNREFLDGLPPSPGYPKLYVSDADGWILQVQDPTTFVHEGSYSAALFLGFLRRWAPPSEGK